MPKSSRQPSSEITFNESCEHLEAALRDSTRGEIVDALRADGAMPDALARLRAAMRAHAFPAARGSQSFRRVVGALDARSRGEGLHVLEGWDYRAHRFPDDIVPVLLLDYCTRAGIPEGRERAALAILLDQYFLSLLALLAVRAWDEGDPNVNLDRVSALVRDLQGPEGAGLRVVDDAETLVMLAIAYYNPEEASFPLLLGKVGALDDAHRIRVALPCAAIMGSHLRWGLRFMYRRDVGAMRDDNVVDYPWLLFAVLTLLRAYDRMHERGTAGAARDDVVEGLLNGLSPDPWAFTGATPACLRDCRADHEEARALLARHRAHLGAEFERQRPSPSAYSPLGLGCNFLSNAVVAAVAVALGEPRAGAQPSLNALFTREHEGVAPDAAAAAFARRLMAFSSAEPERLGAGGAPLIVYDPYDAVHGYNSVMRGTATETA